MPESLYKRLFTKLKFQDFDLNERVQMIIDEDDDAMYLRAIKALKSSEDIFLVDHAWTFRQRSAYKDLYDNEKLLERLENITKFSHKKELPGPNPFKKEDKKLSLDEYLAKQKES